MHSEPPFGRTPDQTKKLQTGAKFPAVLSDRRKFTARALSSAQRQLQRTFVGAFSDRLDQMKGERWRGTQSEVDNDERAMVRTKSNEMIGGAVFPLLGAITYWFPKFTGRLMPDGLGKVGFWTLFLGFQLAFFPMHIAGIYGMPRRVYAYPSGMGLELPNLLSSIGSFAVAAAVLMFVINMALSMRRGRLSGDNPWDAASLEWTTASPPPTYNFDHLPIVDGRAPLWDSRERRLVFGLRVNERELLLSSVLDAVPDVREPSAEPSPWPMIAAVAVSVMFVCSIFSPWALVVGALPCTAALVAWFWPKSAEPRGEPVIS
jgi:cytochrome c oxidase subunit 1